MKLTKSNIKRFAYFYWYGFVGKSHGYKVHTPDLFNDDIDGLNRKAMSLGHDHGEEYGFTVYFTVFILVLLTIIDVLDRIF